MWKKPEKTEGVQGSTSAKWLGKVKIEFPFYKWDASPRFCKGKTEVSEVNSYKINYTVTSLIASVQQKQ